MERYKRLFVEIKALADATSLPVTRVASSFLACRYGHGATWDNFKVLKMYAMDNKARRKVYTFRRQKTISDFLNRNASSEELQVIMDKNKFNTVFAEFIKRDWYDSTVLDEDRYDEFLERNNRFLLKPIRSSQGKGIELYNAKEIDIDSFFSRISSGQFILEEYIIQHPSLAEINPSSVNTIRLATVRLDDHVHILQGGALRCGGQDAIVDNFHHGGYAYPIDIANGVVDGPGRMLNKTERVYRHPTTGKEMLGFQIPNWDAVIDTVKRAAMVMDNVGYIGWDIAVLSDGCEIIEANVNYPDTDVHQLDGCNVYDDIRSFLLECGEGERFIR